MGISQALLWYMLLAAIAVGGGLGVWYDVLHLTRMLIGLEPASAGEGRTVKRRRAVPAYIVRFLEDLAFSLSCGVALILLLYYTNDGRFRLMAVIGMIGGYATYRLTIGRLFNWAAPRLVCGVHWLIRQTLCLLLLPIRWLVRWWQCTVGAAIRRMLQRRRERIAERYTKQGSEAYIQAAAHGFELWREEEKDT